MLRHFLDLAVTMLKFVYFIEYRNSLFTSAARNFQARAAQEKKVETIPQPRERFGGKMDFGTDLILKRPLESSSGESRREAVVMAGSNSRCCLSGYGFLL